MDIVGQPQFRPKKDLEAATIGKWVLEYSITVRRVQGEECAIRVQRLTPLGVAIRNSIFDDDKGLIVNSNSWLLRLETMFARVPTRNTGALMPAVCRTYPLLDASA
jgi:hypothetical protein